MDERRASVRPAIHLSSASEHSIHFSKPNLIQRTHIIPLQHPLPLLFILFYLIFFIIPICPPSSPLAIISLFSVCMGLLLFCFLSLLVWLYFKFHIRVKSYSICLSLSDLFPFSMSSRSSVYTFDL